MCYSRCALLVSLLLCFKFSTHAATRKGCSLNVLRSPDEKLLPVLLFNQTTDFSLVVPEQGYINLNSGEGITLVCPGPKNSLMATNSNSTLATCIQGTNLKLFKKSFDFNELFCKTTVRSDIQQTNRRCGNGSGKVTYIGYQVTRSFFKPIIEVCYDEELGTTLYTEHTIHGKAIKYASKASDRPSFSSSGLGMGIAANVAYKRVFQKSTFNQLLGSAHAAERYITSKSYLSRGHLSPDADFLFASSQFATYYYINTCPQWQAINGANWVNMENNIRKTAVHYQSNFIIITGTHDILKIPDDHGKEIPIFMVSRKKIPVPKFIWKIMYSEDSKKGIAFVSLNNPFVHKITKDDILCRNICEQYGWAFDRWSDLAKGYIYCCNINELSRNVENVPHLKVSGVLHGIF